MPTRGYWRGLELTSTTCRELRSPPRRIAGSRLVGQELRRPLRPELRRQTDDRSWTIHEIDSPVEEHGPLAPLVIRAIEGPDGTTFRVVAESQERVMRRFPNARLAGEKFLSTETRIDYERLQGSSFWGQVAILLLGIPRESIARLGGFRVVTPEGEILHEDLLDRPA